ncbi:MAG: hypothetical protein AAGI07_08230 [Bacteroidota bacterium]
MSIRLGNNCENCENLTNGNMCKVHNVKVGSHYTCDSFDMKDNLMNERNCTTCLRFEREDCANPTKAAPGMLCSVWAPQTMSA